MLVGSSGTRCPPRRLRHHAPRRSLPSGELSPRGPPRRAAPHRPPPTDAAVDRRVPRCGRRRASHAEAACRARRRTGSPVGGAPCAARAVLSGTSASAWFAGSRSAASCAPSFRPRGGAVGVERAPRSSGRRGSRSPPSTHAQRFAARSRSGMRGSARACRGPCAADADADAAPRTRRARRLFCLAGRRLRRHALNAFRSNVSDARAPYSCRFRVRSPS